MNPIEETIKQLEAARDRATDLIAGLREFQSGVGAGIAPTIAAPIAPAAKTPQPARLVNITKSKPKQRFLPAVTKPAAAKRAVKSPEPKTPAAPTPPLRSFANLDKPESLGAAMKLEIRTLTKFTGEELRDRLLADEHNKALLEAASSGLFQANLTYWAKQGHLTTSGEETPLKSTYTIGNKEFFGA